jgi:hypothetical protein
VALNSDRLSAGIIKQCCELVLGVGSGKGFHHMTPFDGW